MATRLFGCLLMSSSWSGAGENTGLDQVATTVLLYSSTLRLCPAVFSYILCRSSIVELHCLLY